MIMIMIMIVIMMMIVYFLTAKTNSGKSTALNRNPTDTDIFIAETNTKPKQYEVEIRQSSGDEGDGVDNTEGGAYGEPKDGWEGLDQVAKVTGNRRIHGGRRTRKLLSVVEDSKNDSEKLTGMENYSGDVIDTVLSDDSTKESHEIADMDDETEKVTNQKSYNSVFQPKGKQLRPGSNEHKS